MTAVFKRAHKKADAAAEDTAALRRCLVSGVLKPRAEMIRFVIGPDKTVVPDIAEKLPGAGFWVTATSEAVSQAAKKKLFGKAQAPASLASDAARLLRKRCLDLLGLSKRAGIAVLGESQTEHALREGKLALFLRAPDATSALDNRREISECANFSRDEMGAAFGYDQIAYAGLMPHGLTEKLMVEIKRLGSMTIGLTVGKNEG